jgi:hypothetical protein
LTGSGFVPQSCGHFFGQITLPVNGHTQSPDALCPDAIAHAERECAAWIANKVPPNASVAAATVKIVLFMMQLLRAAVHDAGASASSLPSQRAD